jgi:hypothetical protein
MARMKRSLLALSLCLFCSSAWAQTEGMELNFGGTSFTYNPGNGLTYHPFKPHNVRASNAPSGSLVITTSPTDYYVKAWKDGWLTVTGNVMLVLDPSGSPPGIGYLASPNFTFRLFKNGAVNDCSDASGAAPVASQPAYQFPGLWHVLHIPVTFKTWASADDKFRFCLQATTNGPSSYIDGNTAHTRLTVTIDSPGSP